MSMTPQQALALIGNTRDWPNLLECIERVCLAVDLNCIQNEKPIKFSEIPDYMFDSRL